MTFFRKKKSLTILCVGLENSGKSTIINYMKPSNEKIKIIPTAGFSVEKFSYGGVKYTMYDMSGQGRYRGMWEYFFGGIEGIIFSVDCKDHERVSTARDELHLLLRDRKLKQCPILIFANKQDDKKEDAEGPIPPQNLDEILELQKFENLVYDIRGSIATTGEGIGEGMSFLSQNARKL